MKTQTRLGMCGMLCAVSGWGCLQDPFKITLFTPSDLTKYPLGAPIMLMAQGKTTGYNGKGDGASGMVTISGFSDKPAFLKLNTFLVTPDPSTIDWSAAGISLTFTFGVTPIAGGMGNLVLQPTCVPYDGTPVMLPFTTGIPGGITLPPTFYNTPDALSRWEPVSTATGELFGHDEKADLRLNSPLLFEFRRYYASYLSGNGVTSALGTNWMHNFDVKLKLSGTTATMQLFHGKKVTFTQSGGGWKLSSTERTPYQLAAAGSGYQFLDARTNLVYGFDSGGVLASVQDRNGNTLMVTQTAGGIGPSQVSDGLGHTLTFTYTGSNLTKVQDNAGRTVNFEYTSGNLSAWTNANGKRASSTYTFAGGINGLMTASVEPMGNLPYSQQYDSQGRVSQQTDSSGTAMALTYAASGTTATEPQGVSLTHVYDNNYNVISQSDPTGATNRYVYDANGRATSITDRLGNKTMYTWDAASGQIASLTNPLGAVTKFTYTASSAGGFTSYDLSGILYADGTSVVYTRDSKGNILSVTDPAGKTQTLTRNARGQILTETNPTGAVTTLTYGTDGTLASAQLNSGDITKYGYDSAGRVNLVTRPDGSTQQYTYDADGNLTQTPGATQGYDANDRLVTVTDALAARTAGGYDSNNRRISVTDPLGKTAVRNYDALGRLQSTTDASGVSLTNSYDALNRRTGIVDATGKGLALGYDTEARLTSVTDALGRKTTATLNASGDVTALSTALGERFTVTYDALRRPISRTDPLGRVGKSQYDARGLLTNVTLPGNVTASWAYNDLGLATSLTDPNGNTWQRAWDSMGRLTATTDPLGQTAKYAYDSGQRISQVTFSSGTLQITYGGQSVSGLTWSDGTNLSYTYDANHRLTAANGSAFGYDAAGRMNSCNGLAITRDAAGRIAGITYASGKTVQYTYDNRGLLVQVKDWVGGVTSLAYDAAQELTSITYPNGVQETYTYDNDGWRSSIKAAKGASSISSITLQRDALGRVTSANRTAAQIPALPVSYTPLAFDAASQAAGATYDSLGRVKGDTNHTYTWDLAGRLTSYQVLNGTTNFTYDGLGGRISSASGSATQDYVLNYATPLSTIAVVRSGSADQRYYVWTPDGALLYMVDAGTGARHFYHFDETGSTAALTDESGAATDTYAVAPYGESVTHSGPTDNPFTYQGRLGVMQEGTTGLYYMRARYYDSGSARFLSRDPASGADARSMNPYQFAYGNPEGLADPSGLRPALSEQVALRAGFIDMEEIRRLPLSGKGPSLCLPRLGAEITINRPAMPAEFGPEGRGIATVDPIRTFDNSQVPEEKRLYWRGYRPPSPTVSISIVDGVPGPNRRTSDFPKLFIPFMAPAPPPPPRAIGYDGLDSLGWQIRWVLDREESDALAAEQRRIEIG